MLVAHARPLADYIARIFAHTGSPDDEARMVAEHLVGANLRGHDSHGVIRTAGYVTAYHEGRLRPGARLTVVRESASTALIDGGCNYGQVVAWHTMNAAIAKARETGIGLVSVYATGHIGRVGAYGEQAVAAGALGFGGVNSPGSQMTAPYGGAQRRLGTNPIMFALPTGDPAAPFVLDMATSVVAEGKPRVRVNRGEQVPEGWLIDGDGNPTTDPRDLYGTGNNPTPGALLTLGGPNGGYKGFGLSMVIEALSGLLSGAGTAIEGLRNTNGVFLGAIDIGHFRPVDEFTAGFDALAQHVKQPPFAPGFDGVMLAGEPERRVMAVRLEKGIPIEDETWRQIVTAGTSVGVSPTELPPGG
jgi:hydroxycarboxylate dehydrogenase B